MLSFLKGVIMGSADITCQKFIENRENIEPVRTLRFAIIGSCLVVSTILFLFLEFDVL